MDDKTISIEKIKAALSVASLAVLTVQHSVALFNADAEISYIPLSITYLTIFINTLGEKKMKLIQRLSLSGFVLVALSGLVIYTVAGNELVLNEVVEQWRRIIMFLGIALISLGLCILYIKRIVCDIK